VTKTELVDAVAQAMGLSRADSQRTVEGVLDAIADGIAKQGKVLIQGFGTFTKKQRKARKGRNPQTKEEITIPASTTVTFKPGQELKNRL
jgi:DNA-binding protein HU-beta